MTDLTQFFNFNRPPNGGYGQPQNLIGSGGGGVGVGISGSGGGLGGVGGVHNVGGQQQASFDINEFPSLSKMSLLSQMQASSRANYVNIAKDNSTSSTTNNNQSSSSSSVDNAQSEFTISSEDFPALPGANNTNISIIGQKLSGATNKPSSSLTSSSTTTTLTNNNINNLISATANSLASLSLSTQTAQTTNFNSTNNNSSSSNSSDTGLGLSTTSTLNSIGANNGIGGLNANAHMDIGTTAAIDQCGREKSYFSPIVSTPQKSMWMNGAVDRQSLLGSPANIHTTNTTTSTTATTNHLSLGDYKSKLDAEQAARFKIVSDGLNDYSISGHTNDFYNQASMNAAAVAASSSLSSGKEILTTINGSTPTTAISGNNINMNNSSSNSNKGVQISNDGRVTNIPSSMVTDQFGMIGLLAFLRAAETDPNLASVTFGTDLTALGLNLTATEKLYPSFAGPWTDQPLKVYEIDYPVPSEYLVNSLIAAAIELYSREWRYHKEEKVWITRAPGFPPSEKTNSYERGTYYIFDAHLWRRVPREFVLEYDRLESKPTI